MKRIGVVGLGDMGIGLAKNLISGGFEVTGFDIREDRRKQLSDLGGKAADTTEEVGRNADTVFVMVLNGDQVKEVVLGPKGLLESLVPGATIIVTATIRPSEVRELVGPSGQKGVKLLDSPVSGGKSGADNGTLTLMTAGDKAVFDENHDVLSAIGKTIFHVGDEIGIGQTVKAALQALIGSSFTAIFESLVLGAKAGVKAETMYEVFGASAVASPLFKNAAKLIMERRFVGTGSHIGTMYKDLTISMAMAKEVGVPMFTASAAMELFQAGKSMFPNEDNWAVTKVLEQIAGTEVKQG